MSDSLSVMIKDYLIISKLKKDLRRDFQPFANTNSPEAFKYFIYGNNSFATRDYATATGWYLQALNIDSAFVDAAIRLSGAYLNQGLFMEGERWCRRIYEKRAQMPMQQKIMTNIIYTLYFEPLSEGIKYCRQLLEIDDQQPMIYYQLGWFYRNLNQYDQAIPEYEKALEIYNKWGSKPMWVPNYTALGYAYHKTGQYKKEEELYKKAERDFPDDPAIIYRLAVLSLSEGKIKDSDHYIEKYKYILKENSAPEVRIMDGVAGIYYDANILDKAEEYYRKALSLEPDNPDWLNALAYFLIDSDRKINEGLELIDKALKISPNDYLMIDTRGWGLYKQGKYQEALVVLQKSWDLKPIYDHEVYLHLEAAKKVVANLKRTDH
jgi:tetratricopeptide (TPR) repeat protein